MLSEKLRRFGRSFRNIWSRLRGGGPATATPVDELDRRGANPRAIAPADIAVLQSLGRLQAIEPFEGWQHLEAVRATMNSLERGLDWVVDRGRGLRDQFERRGVMQKARDQWRRIVGGGDQKSGALRRRFDRGYRDAGEWLRTSGMQSLQNSLGSLLAHDPAQWVRKRAAKILQRRDLEDVTDAAQALDAMRKLKPDERPVGSVRANIGRRLLRAPRTARPVRRASGQSNGRGIRGDLRRVSSARLFSRDASTAKVAGARRV